MLYVLKCIKYITFYENSHSERERLYYYRFNANLFLRNKNCIKRVENYFPFYKIGVFCEFFLFSNLDLLSSYYESEYLLLNEQFWYI